MNPDAEPKLRRPGAFRVISRYQLGPCRWLPGKVAQLKALGEAASGSPRALAGAPVTSASTWP